MFKFELVIVHINITNVKLSLITEKIAGAIFYLYNMRYAQRIRLSL